MANFTLGAPVMAPGYGVTGVGTSEITDLSITDADISASAAIAASKLAGVTRAASTATYAARVTYTSGDITVSSSSWANLPSVPTISLTAATGDWVEVGVCGTWTGASNFGLLDVASVVSGSPVNYWGTDAVEAASSAGVPSWVGDPGTARIGGSVFRKLVSDDISAGVVLLQLRAYRGVGNKTLVATDAAAPFVWWARNHG